MSSAYSDCATIGTAGFDSQVYTDPASYTMGTGSYVKSPISTSWTDYECLELYFHAAICLRGVVLN
jgi:hypothetical protein